MNKTTLQLTTALVLLGAVLVAAPPPVSAGIFQCDQSLPLPAEMVTCSAACMEAHDPLDLSARTAAECVTNP